MATVSDTAPEPPAAPRHADLSPDEHAGGNLVATPPVPTTGATVTGAAPEHAAATRNSDRAPDERTAYHLATYAVWALSPLPDCRRPERPGRRGPFFRKRARLDQVAWQTRQEVRCRACGDVMRGAGCGAPGEPLHFGCWRAAID